MPNQAAIDRGTELPDMEPPRMEILPWFQSEADALARIIALAFEPTRKLVDPAPKAVVRLIAEALQSAYEADQPQ